MGFMMSSATIADSLSTVIIDLIFIGSSEALLDSVVSPQSRHGGRQFFGQLFFVRMDGREHELAVFLQHHGAHLNIMINTHHSIWILKFDVKCEHVAKNGEHRVDAIAVHDWLD